MFSITCLTVKGAKTYERDFFQTASSPRPKKRLCHVRSAAVLVGFLSATRRHLRGFGRFGLTVEHGADGGGMRTGMVFRRLKNAAPNGAEAV
ncbi:hypothetical protein [Neisseria sp. oral taxon 014]|uniref:hypothetical protein n=1 Tax=Neisseria sp. oral taxon 014 TaxID=641148 RepID=UPI0025D8E83F|nr:hypothetical protein [Neisseria sp. oral taxon 014]